MECIAKMYIVTIIGHEQLYHRAESNVVIQEPI